MADDGEHDVLAPLGLLRQHARAHAMAHWLQMQGGVDSTKLALQDVQCLKPQAPSRHADYLDKLRKGVAGQQKLLSAYGVAHVNQKAQQAKGAIEQVVSRKVVTEVGSTAQRKSLDAWDQGNLAMYTEDSLKSRSGLRNDRRVRSALQLWWQTCLGPDGDADAGVDYEHYAGMLRRIYRTMVPEFDSFDAMREIESSWYKHTNRRRHAPPLTIPGPCGLSHPWPLMTWQVRGHQRRRDALPRRLLRRHLPVTALT
jgi:hypothetical protein